MLRLLFGSWSDQQHSVRVEGAEVEFDEEVLLPEVPRPVLDQRETALSVAVLERIRLVRVAAHLEESRLEWGCPRTK